MALTVASPAPPASGASTAARPPRPGGAGEAVLAVRGLGKRFPVRRGWAETLLRPLARRHATALDGVEFSVRRGEVFGLLGPNGAGKTTLLKILSTLVLPDQGTATVGGHDLLREPAAVRRLLRPIIPDERSLMWRVSARENLALYATLHGLRGRAAAERVREVTALVGLEDAGEKMVGQFSTGMRQRLLLARGLLTCPAVLLLDEPTRGLDPVSARRFRAFLRERVVEGAGCTLLIATHGAEEALDLCDRVAVLDAGRVLAAGTPAELSLEAAGARYRVWTTQPDHPALGALEAEGACRRVAARAAEEDGWTVVELEAAGGSAAAARVTAVMGMAGMPFARFERVQPSLAEVIERIVAARGGQDGRAAAGAAGAAGGERRGRREARRA